MAKDEEREEEEEGTGREEEEGKMEREEKKEKEEQQAGDEGDDDDENDEGEKNMRNEEALNTPTTKKKRRKVGGGGGLGSRACPVSSAFLDLLSCLLPSPSPLPTARKARRITDSPACKSSPRRVLFPPASCSFPLCSRSLSRPLPQVSRANLP